MSQGSLVATPLQGSSSLTARRLDVSWADLPALRDLVAGIVSRFEADATLNDPVSDAWLCMCVSESLYVRDACMTLHDDYLMVFSAGGVAH